MNANFGPWTNDKEEASGDPSEGQIDPTFAQHQDSDFPTVDDVTAAAVANAQREHSAHQTSNRATHGHGITQVHHSHQQHDDHVRAAQAAAELQRAQQQAAQQASDHSHQQMVAAAAAGVGGMSPTSNSSESKKQQVARLNRPVSTTKRAAQNRSAQRAFRQRKEKYIRDLEQQATEVNQLKQTIEELRNENLQLRDYTLALQSRVIELSPPNSHSLTAPGSGQPNPSSAQENVPTPPAAVFNNKIFNSDK